MEALSVSSARIGRHHLFYHRVFSFSSLPPFSPNFQRRPSISLLPQIRSSFSIIKCSFSAKPSSELRKSNQSSPPLDDKLIALRRLFANPTLNIDAYVIPSQDAHQSEFIAECYMRRAFISGFTGSAGTAVVTKDKAALWTDGRYFLQAEKELSSCWILMRAGNTGVPTMAEWLNDVLPSGSKVGIDPFLFSFDAAEELREDISKKKHDLVLLSNINLVDEVWKMTRPKPPSGLVRLHELKYAGVDVSQKLSWLRSELTNAGCSSIIVTKLDEIAWLLNLRGSDIPNSPVMYAYLIVDVDGADLFIDDSKITSEVMDYLQSAGIKLKPYETILKEVENLAVEGARLMIDTAAVNAAIIDTFKTASRIHEKKGHSTKSYGSSNGQFDGATALYKSSPIAIAKALKNPAEIEGMRNSHLRDAAALAQFWAWLEDEIRKGVILTEVEVADKLLEFRTSQDGFLDTSFDTISGSGPNGAIIHYKPEPGSCSVVDPTKLFLLDSGAQYVDGTTDITRTVHFGEPTAREKECFTRVLQGHIALDQAVFPENTPGFVLDAFARSSLWKVGLDYRHGTGHGVGAALNVHEGPQSISFRFGNLTPLQKGMIVSNEPGYYEDHAFGIRIENLLCVKEIATPNRFGGIGYLGFEKLTFVPIQGKMIDLSLLSASEVDWLDDYHDQVWQKVSPLLDGLARQWLWDNTRHLVKQ
ncbi:aminopeptidase P2 [Silene latifolia]|uniref:aminopeptidase P2 n=1 Tax=Silene latifolia TaxID=37657 RepID=UPI003D76B81A